jgi:hypothetical protein
MRQPLGPVRRMPVLGPTPRLERCSRLSGHRPRRRIAAGMGPRHSGLSRDTRGRCSFAAGNSTETAASDSIGPGWSNRVHNALRLVGPESGLHPAATFVRRPGCFAYQVDVLHASYLIVFRAVLR